MMGIILAAGMGKRLRPLTFDVPKALVSLINGKCTCLDQVIQNIMPCVDEVIVVTGYKSDSIIKFLEENYSKVRWTKVESVTPGNFSSLLSALPYIKDEEFLITNVDHVFPKCFFKKFIEECKDRETYVAVQSTKVRKIQADEMKVVVDGQNNVLDFSKNLPWYNGAYVGAALVRNPEVFLTSLEELTKENHVLENLCIEDVFKHMAKNGKPTKAVWMGIMKWFEIDTIEDLKKAREEIRKNESAYI